MKNRNMKQELEELERRYDAATQMRDRLHRVGDTAEMNRLKQEIGYLSRRITSIRKQLEKEDNADYV